MNIKVQSLEDAGRPSHDPSGPAGPEGRMTPGRSLFYKKPLWRCRHFSVVYLLFIFLSLKPTNRYFTKGVLLKTCADLFLHHEIMWKREIIPCYKPDYFGIPSFSAHSHRSVRDREGMQWQQRAKAGTPLDVRMAGCCCHTTGNLWVHKCVNT